MSCPSFPHPSVPSSSDISDFPSFPVINDTSVSSQESTSIVTKSDSSSLSTLSSSNMAPQDCSSSPELAFSMSPLKFPSQTEYSSTTPCESSPSRSQAACSSLRLDYSIPEHTHSTLNYSSKSQTEYSPSLNGTSTFHTFSHSFSSVNCSSISQPPSSSFKSPLHFSSTDQCSPTSGPNSTSISQTTYSFLSPQTCKSISEHTHSMCPSISQMNGASTSRSDNYLISSLDSSSCYILPPNQDPSDFSPTSISDRSIFSVYGGPSTPPLNCQPVGQHAKTTHECLGKSLSDNCSLVSSISPLDIPCICTCELPTDFPPEISSSHLSSYHPCSPVINDNLMSSRGDCSYPNHSGASSHSPHESPYILQSQNYLALSNITPINGTTPQQIDAATHPCGKFTSTNHNNKNCDPLTTSWSTQSFQSSTFPQTGVISSSDDRSVDHLLANGHYSHDFATKPIPSCSLPNSIDSSANSYVLNSPHSSHTPPAQDITCPNSTDQTVSNNSHEKYLKMLPCCPHASPSGVTPKYVLFPEEENQVRECEVCKASLENKVRMDQDRQLCEHFLDSLSRFEDWLQTAQITTSQGNPYKTLHQESKLALRKYEVLLTEMRAKLLDLESLNRQYWRLTQTPQQTLLPSVLRSRMQEVNTLWDSLQGETETLHRTFKSRVQQREEFETDQDDMKLCLTEMDLELSNVEYIYGGNSTEKIQQLKAFQEDVWSNMKKVEGLLERGDELIVNSDPQDASDLEVEMTELGSYCQQIYIRLSRLQKRLVSTKLVFEDDFLDGAIEHLSSGSSDVFLDLDIEDGEVSSPVNVPFTNAALPVDLEWDPLGDVGGSSSHDGQESFYTATSAPSKRHKRSEGSRSSLSSYSGITYSHMKRQEVKDTLADIHTNHTPSQDTCRLEQTQEQFHGRGQIKNSLALHNSLLQVETGMGQDIVSCSASFPIDEPDCDHRMDDHGRTADPERSSHADLIDSQSQPNCSGQRRRQRKKKRTARNQDAKGNLRPTKPDVSILMENGDDLSHQDLHKTSYRTSCSLCLWFRRLAFASVVLLVMLTSLLLPWGRQTCLSKRFSWSLMLTYVNGPPPT